MKIIFTSDWHADVMTQGVDRYPEIDKSVMESVEYAIEQKADIYMMLGDLADPDNVRSHRANALAMSAAESLNVYGVRSFWLVGNHDVIEDGTGASTMMSLQHSPGNLFHEPARIDHDELSIIALPFTPTSHRYDPAEFIRKQAPLVQGQKVLIIGHLNLKHNDRAGPRVHRGGGAGGRVRS